MRCVYASLPLSKYGEMYLWKYSEALPLKINWPRVSDFGLLCRDFSQETGIFHFLTLSLAGNSDCLTQVQQSSCWSSPTCSLQCVWCFCASRQRNGCQCLGFLTCVYVLKRVIAHRGFRNTVRQSALEVDFGRKIPCCAGDLNP